MGGQLNSCSCARENCCGTADGREEREGGCVTGNIVWCDCGASEKEADGEEVLFAELLPDMIAHVVGLKFLPELSEEEIVKHFEEEVALHKRMPELVPFRSRWSYSKNQSGSLFPNDRGAALNNGSEWIVVVWLESRRAMSDYGPHPKHQELVALQADKLAPDGKMVLDATVNSRRTIDANMHPKGKGPWILHVVGIRFVEGLSEHEIERHFEQDVALHERMPELVPDRELWGWGKNNSGPLYTETDRGSVLNHGAEYVVYVWLAGRDALLAFGPHPKHQELNALQGKHFLVEGGKCVLDPIV